MQREKSFFRLFGDAAILSRLGQLGAAWRTTDNLVAVGFPQAQLEDARQAYAQTAKTPQEHYAIQKMAQGFFEDESLLKVFCRYFECTDWKLEASPWFLSPQEYQHIFTELIAPIKDHQALLDAGEGEEHWGEGFLKLPFDLGMVRARCALWEEIRHKDYFWNAQNSYAHHRARQLFAYLQRSIDITCFSPSQFNYAWEQQFRSQFAAALERFESTLERRVREWQEQRKARQNHRFHYRHFSSAQALAAQKLAKALAHLRLDPTTVTLSRLKQAFRRLSKNTHPDHGGDAKAFRQLTMSKEIIETWLHQRHDKPSP